MDRFPATLDPTAADQSDSGARRGRAFFLLSAVVLLISAGLLVYSQTMAFVWDEGFHLLAAQLINAGKTLYIDFCFAQTPLNAFWNAAWMRVFGESWRVTHVSAALLVAGSVFLIADFVLVRFAVPRWRLPCAIVVAAFVGLNNIVVEFGTVAQAYGIGLFLTVASFRAAILARGKSVLWPFAAGLLSGAAADCTLLTAPAVPVLLIWMLFYNAAGKRWTKSIAFLGGVFISFAPVIWLFAKAPRIVFFDIVQYQALYRRADWPTVNSHDLDVLSDWLNSAQVLLMGSLAIAGLMFLIRKSNWERGRRAEFYLCAWLAGALAVYIATTHPTFDRYFVFVVPFLSVIAAIGLYATAVRLGDPNRPFLPAFLATLLVGLALAKALFDDRDATTWKDYEKIAAKVDQVTPRNGVLFADELVYFLLRRAPPRGMEFSYSHKVQLPRAQEAALHIISAPELKNEVKAGKFDTVQTCNDDKIDEFGLPQLYAHKADVGDCSVFWGKVRTSTAPAPAREK